MLRLVSVLVLDFKKTHLGRILYFTDWMMTVLNATAGLKANSSFHTLFLAALLWLGPVDPSLIPLSRTSSDTDTVYIESASSSQVRRTINRNRLSFALDRDGSPFLHRHIRSHSGGLHLNLEGAEAPDIPGPGPPATSIPSVSQRSKRKRRNQVVDSSDPLCLHGQRGRCSHSQREEQTPEPETEQSHAISKETITSTSDDPFNVVQPPGGVGSPRSVWVGQGPDQKDDSRVVLSNDGSIFEL